ncbi:unnamed protein product, partial [Effrenium voratum]
GVDTISMPSLEGMDAVQASDPGLDWRVREDIDALSRRLDALEVLCREPGRGLQGQIHTLTNEVRRLEDVGMEQTRDTAGLRARVAVEELAAAQRAEVEKLEAQMADLQQGVEERLRVLAAELRSEAAMRCAEVRAEMLKLPEVQVSRLELDVQESPQPGSTGYDKATELDSSLGSLGSFGSLKESTEQLRRCLKDLAQVPEGAADMRPQGST